MNEIELRHELNNFSRENLIEWLSWNEQNGVYNHEDSIKEIGHIMSYEEDVELMVKQIIYDNEIHNI